MILRRGFYLDIMNYRETLPVSLGQAQSEELVVTYDKIKSDLGHVSYTEMARALQVTPQEVMQHVKYLHVHSKEWEVRFSSNRHNENVYFKLLKRSAPSSGQSDPHCSAIKEQ
jgi:hypothetical protein